MRRKPGKSLGSSARLGSIGVGILLAVLVLSGSVPATGSGTGSPATGVPGTVPSVVGSPDPMAAGPSTATAAGPSTEPTSTASSTLPATGPAAPSRLAAHSISLSASKSVVTVGGAVSLTGHTSSTAARQRVYLQRREIGQTAWHSLSSTLTASGGTYRFRVGPQCISGYRVKWLTATDNLTVNARANLTFRVMDSYITYGDSAMMKLYLKGRIKVGVHVQVRRKNASMSDWATLRDSYTNDNGGLYAYSSPMVNTAYLAKVVDDRFVVAQTVAYPLKVRPRLTLAVGRTTVHTRSTVAMSGRLVPPEEHHRVSLQTSTDGRTWHQVSEPTVSETGSYRANWFPDKAGTFWVRAAVPASSDMTAVASLYLPNKRVFPVGGRLYHDSDRAQISWDRLGWTLKRAWAGLVHHDYPASDIMAPHGFPVYASMGGTIRRADRDGESTSGGNDVTIVGRDGRIYYYAHLMSINRSIVVGRKVDSGRQLGTVGCSGNASHNAPHLHFGMSRPGGHISGGMDPFPFLDPAWVKVFVRTPAYVAKKVIVR